MVRTDLTREQCEARELSGSALENFYATDSDALSAPISPISWSRLGREGGLLTCQSALPPALPAALPYGLAACGLAPLHEWTMAMASHRTAALQAELDLLGLLRDSMRSTRCQNAERLWIDCQTKARSPDMPILAAGTAWYIMPAFVPRLGKS